MRIIFFYCLIILNAQLIFGQKNKTDSILSLNKSDFEKVKLLKELTTKNIDNSTIKDFKTTINELIRFAKRIDDKKVESQALLMLAEKYKRKRELDSSLFYISKSIKKLQSIKHDSLLIKAYNSKAGIYNHFQKYDSAAVYFKKGIDTGEKSHNLQLLGYAYNGYSSVLSNQGQDTKAIEISQKSLNIAQENNFKKLEIISLTNLGWKLLKAGNNDKSFEYLESAYKKYDPKYIDDKEVLCDILRFLTLNCRRSGKLELVQKYGSLGVECYESTGNIMLASDITNTIGAGLLEKEKYKEAVPVFERLIKKSKKINSQIGVNFGKINLSSALINIKEFKKGEDLLLETLKDTIHTKFLPKRVEKVVYQNLAEVNELTNNYETALKYHKKFKFLEDSLSSASKLKQITEIDTKYQTEQKERELAEQKIATQEQELLTQKANTRNWLLVFGVLASLISALFIWRRYKSEAKAKQIISEQKDEIEQQKNTVEILQKELHHRMKNNLSFIDLFINLAKGRFEDEAYQTKLNELQNRMRSMFEVHKQLFKKDDITSVKAKNYIDTLVKNVQEAYAKENISILNKTKKEETILADTSFPVGLIVNEFVTNSYKYAFNDTEKGIIDINLSSNSKSYTLSLKDNGKGLPKDFDIDSLDSFGLETIQLLTQEYGGTFNIDGSNGVAMNITLPKTAA